MNIAIREQSDLREERRLRAEIEPQDPLKRIVLAKLRWDGNVLGRALDRIVVIIDGSFWFETDDFELMERGIERASGRIEVWVRRERGSELFRRFMPRKAWNGTPPG